MRLIYGLLNNLAKFGLALIVVGLFSFILLALLTFETQAQLQNPAQLSPDSAQVAGQFLRRVSRQVIKTQNPIKISGTANELNSLFQVISHNYPRVHAAADFKNGSAKLLISLELFTLGKKIYINANANMEDSASGITWSNLQIGHLPLSDNFANTFFSRLVHIMFGKRYGRGLLKGIRDLKILDKGFSLHFHPDPQFHQGISAAINRLGSYSGHSINFEAERVQYYLDLLNTYATSFDNHKLSLSHILQVLLQETAMQTKHSNLAADRENTAALFALAINNSNTTFKHFVTGISPENQNRKIRLTLAGREDLAKHFVYSVALKLLADSGLSLSIGETKEIHDAGHKGSGFSFADLAADKAGIQFAELASGTPEGASYLHNFSASELNETDFFPSINDLPEGLSQQKFKEEYTSTNSPKYKAILQIIDQRIQDTKLHGDFHSHIELE